MIRSLLLSLAVTAAGTAFAADEIVIGQIAPLTGTIAGTGDEYVAGAAAYFAHINAKGGIYGRKIRVVVKDDSYKPDQTLALTRQLLAEDKPVALFGFVGTGNVMAAGGAGVPHAHAEVPAGEGDLVRQHGVVHRRQDPGRGDQARRR